MTDRDRMVEQVARAVAAASLNIPWAEVSTGAQMSYRQIARAVLARFDVQPKSGRTEGSS